MKYLWNKLSKTEKAALISGSVLVLVAIVNGLFSLVHNSNGVSQTIATNIGIAQVGNNNTASQTITEPKPQLRFELVATSSTATSFNAKINVFVTTSGGQKTTPPFSLVDYFTCSILSSSGGGSVSSFGAIISATEIYSMDCTLTKPVYIDPTQVITVKVLD